jgi:cell wall-associated NlpC family hydrolase
MITLTWSRRLHRALLATTTVLLAAGSLSAAAADRTNPHDEVVLQALTLLGVPYRWGGNDPARGLDCSGLVRHVFKSAVALELPRRSDQMSRLGRSVRRAELRAGDLLFFNTLGRANSHVALYLGDGRFVHAPGRNSQVRVDDLDGRYWQKHFNGARRIELAAVGDVPPVTDRGALVSSLRLEDFPEGP